VASQVAGLEPSRALYKVYEAAAERLQKHGYEAWLTEVESCMVLGALGLQCSRVCLLWDAAAWRDRVRCHRHTFHLKPLPRC